MERKNLIEFYKYQKNLRIDFIDIYLIARICKLV
jgi:hypothetical protein